MKRPGVPHSLLAPSNPDPIPEGVLPEVKIGGSCDFGLGLEHVPVGQWLGALTSRSHGVEVEPSSVTH